MDYIYKVLNLDEWKLASNNGFIITELDQKDGFVHLSTSRQLATTLALYFSETEEVVLAQLCYEEIKNNLKLEAVDLNSKRSGAFYHFYGDLDIKYISKVWNLNRSSFSLPEEVLLQAELPENNPIKNDG